MWGWVGEGAGGWIQGRPQADQCLPPKVAINSVWSKVLQQGTSHSAHRSLANDAYKRAIACTPPAEGLPCGERPLQPHL